MRQLDIFPALQSSTEGIATEFKSARGRVANTQGGTIVFGVAKKPTGLVGDRHFLVNQFYPAHPSARV
ncbi:MAG: hypothetical protein D4R79_03505 [Comamonadaceae bacterium]|nr:MAG: hypothetical protein D4R79_03505 [Comamonadaceae bacterium]